MPLNTRKPPSPRLVSTVHYSRVVASILCQRPCKDPFEHPPVYADNFGKTTFACPPPDYSQINKFVSSKYGCKPMRSQLRSSAWRYKTGRFKENRTPVINKNCWLPIYTKEYKSKIKDSQYCGDLLTPEERKKREKELEKERIRAQFNLLRPTTGKKKRQVTKRILSARGNKSRDKRGRSRRGRRAGGDSDGDSDSGRMRKGRKNNRGIKGKHSPGKSATRRRKGDEGKLSVEFGQHSNGKEYGSRKNAKNQSQNKSRSKKKQKNKKGGNWDDDSDDDYDGEHGRGKKSKKGNRGKNNRKYSAGGDYSPDHASGAKSRKSKKNKKGRNNNESLDDTSDLQALNLQSLLSKAASRNQIYSRTSLEEDKSGRQSRKKSRRLRNAASIKESKFGGGDFTPSRTLREALDDISSRADTKLKSNIPGDLNEHIAQLRKAREIAEQEKKLRLTQSLNAIHDESRKSKRRQRESWEDSTDPAVWEEHLLGSKSKKTRGRRRKHGANEFDEDVGEDPETYFTDKEGNEFYANARLLEKKPKCAQSLWGALPLPTSQLLPNGKAVLCTDEEQFPVPVKSHNILREDLKGGLESFAEIPDQVEKYKQIFRDEARAKGIRRPSTADVTRKMIIRTTQAMHKRKAAQDPDMVLAKLETIKGPSYLKRRGLLPSQSEGGLHSRLKKKSHRESVQLSRLTNTTTLAMSIYEHMKQVKDEAEETIEFPGEDGIPMRVKAPKKEWGPFGHLRPGIVDRTARRFHGVTSGPFIAHVNREDKNRLAISMAETPPRRIRESKNPMPTPTKSGSLEPKHKSKSKNKVNGGNSKLPSLAIREKVSSTSEMVALKAKETNAFIHSLMADKLAHEEEEYEDKLLYHVNTPTKKKRRTVTRRSKKVSRNEEKAMSLPKVIFDVRGEDDEEMQGPWDGSGDHFNEIQMVEVEPKKDRCWEMVSQMFKSPLKVPAIPLPDNLVIHMEKKYPTMEWPRGIPVAMRYYPSGQPFCIVFQNGAGRVHYPHGGIAVLISAPQPKYCRVLVIRDPFDKFYFFDKAVIADLNCTGIGIVYDDKNLVRVQYNLEGGFSQDGLDKPLKRWRWNEGGHRMVLKLNRYMALRILDIDKMFLTFFGNKRGFRINVGAGHEINLMSGSCDSSKDFPPRYSDLKPSCNGFDFIKGRFNSPIVGYVDKGGSRRGQRQDSCLGSQFSRNNSACSAPRGNSATYKLRPCCVLTDCND